jgi:hypothetical protein
MSGGVEINKLLDHRRKLAAQGALLAFEGPNEPNNWAFSLQKRKGGAQLSWRVVANLQHDLYEAVKADPSLMRFPVWSLSENGAQTDSAGL